MKRIEARSVARVAVQTPELLVDAAKSLGRPGAQLGEATFVLGFIAPPFGHAHGSGLRRFGKSGECCAQAFEFVRD